MELVNETMLARKIKSWFALVEVRKDAVPPSLTKDEENIIRYACGYTLVLNAILSCFLHAFSFSQFLCLRPISHPMVKVLATICLTTLNDLLHSHNYTAETWHQFQDNF